MPPSVITKPTGSDTSAALINWMKKIFGKSFTVSRGYSSAHDGIDLPAKVGTPVYALKDGVVSYARDARLESDKGLKGWAMYGGRVVNIDVGNGLRTQFAHLNTINVREGETVKAGQKIGTVGATGGFSSSKTSTFSGPHLHFGLWDTKLNKMINPSGFFNSLGDTTGGAGEGTGEEMLKKLKALGIDTSPTHVITQAEANLIAEKIYPNQTGSVREHIVNFFNGKTIADALKGETGLLSGIPDVGAAITAVGAQLTDTFTWIAVILVGIILIAGGIFLLRPKDS